MEREITIKINPLSAREGYQYFSIDVGGIIGEKSTSGSAEIKAPFSDEEFKTIFKALALLGGEKGKALSFSKEELKRLQEWGIITQESFDEGDEEKILIDKSIKFNTLRELIQTKLYEKIIKDSDIKPKLKRLAEEVIHFSFKLYAKENEQFFHQYPWEILNWPELWEISKICISRYICYEDFVDISQPIQDNKLKVLVVTSRPHIPYLDLGNNTIKDIDGLKEGLKNARGREENSRKQIIDYDELQHPTLPKFKEYLAKNKPHIIHFDGHAEVGKLCEKGHLTTDPDQETCTEKECREDFTKNYWGYLAFEKEEDKNPHWISVQEFGNEILSRYRENVRLVILNACNSGYTLPKENIFDGLATRLIQVQTPAVIGSLFPISFEASKIFSKWFYFALEEGKTLIESMEMAIHQLRDEGNREWYRYVLYMRVAENTSENILKLQGSAPTQDIEKTKVPLKIIPKGLKATQVDEHLEYFENRKKYRNDLKKYFLDKKIPCPIVIEGAPGIGKSALAAKFLEAILEKIDDKNEWSSTEELQKLLEKYPLPKRVIPICLHKNEGKKGISFDNIFEYCIEDLNDEEKKTQLKKQYEDIDAVDEEFIESFLHELNDGLYVIILDNMENLIENEEISEKYKSLRVLIEYSKKFDNVKFIITTYKNLCSSGKKIHLQKLRCKDSVKLFKSLVKGREKELGLESVSENNSELKKICNLVENIPLGINLIVEILEAFPHLRNLPKLKEELNRILRGPDSKCYNLLQKAYSDLSGSEKSVMETLERLVKTVFDSLGNKDGEDDKKEERMIIKALAVFEDGASYDAIHFVLKNFNNDLSEEIIETKLMKPVCKTFLTWDSNCDKVKFQYDIYRKYAYGLIEFEKETCPRFTKSALEKYTARYYWNKALDNPKDKQDLLLQAAKHYKNAGEYKIVVKTLIGSPLEDLKKKGEYGKICNLLEDFVLEVKEFPITKIDKVSQMDILIELGIAYKNTGKLCGSTPNDEKIADDGTLKFLSGKPDGAMNYFDIALKMAQKSNDIKRQSICNHNLGNCYGNLGQIDQAIEKLEESLKVPENILTDKQRGITYHNLGRWYAYQGCDAINWEELQEERERKSERKSALGKAAEEVSGALDKYLDKKTQTFRKSEIFLSAANKIFDKSEETACRANTLVELGHIYFDKEERVLETLKQKYVNALVQAKKAEYRQIQYEALCGLATTYLLFEKNDEAYSNIKKAMDLYKDSSLKFKTYKVQILDGIFEWKQKNIDKATESFKLGVDYTKNLLDLDALYYRCLAYYGLKACSLDDEIKYEMEENAKDVLLRLNKGKFSGIQNRMSKLFELLGDTRFLERSFDSDF